MDSSLESSDQVVSDFSHGLLFPKDNEAMQGKGIKNLILSSKKQSLQVNFHHISFLFIDLPLCSNISLGIFQVNQNISMLELVLIDAKTTPVNCFKDSKEELNH